MIRQIARDVRVVPGEEGTRVGFAVPTRSSSEPSPARPPAATWLRVDSADSDDDLRRVEVLGDLDLEGAHAVRTDLLALCGAAGPGIRLDLRATTFLTSAGAALLLEAADASAAAARTLRVLTRAGSGVHRFLSLHGAAATLGLTDTGKGAGWTTTGGVADVTPGTHRCRPGFTWSDPIPPTRARHREEHRDFHP